MVRGVKIEAKKHQFVLAKKYQKSMSVGVDFGLCLALSFVHSTQENLSSLFQFFGVMASNSLPFGVKATFLSRDGPANTK